VPAAWNLSEAKDPDAHALAAQIYLALAEFDNGDLDEAELKERLAEVVSSAPPNKAGTRRLRWFVRQMAYSYFAGPLSPAD
jgi:hypothetical protein